MGNMIRRVSEATSFSLSIFWRESGSSKRYPFRLWGIFVEILKDELEARQIEHSVYSDDPYFDANREAQLWN